MNRTLAQIVADNVTAAYQASEFTSENVLAEAAGVAPNTLRNLMRPTRREPGKRGFTSATLDALERVAGALGYPAWQLMHEGFSPQNPFGRILSQREVEVYQKWDEAFRSLPPLSPPSSPPPAGPASGPPENGAPAPASTK